MTFATERRSTRQGIHVGTHQPRATVPCEQGIARLATPLIALALMLTACGTEGGAAGGNAFDASTADDATDEPTRGLPAGNADASDRVPSAEASEPQVTKDAAAGLDALGLDRATLGAASMDAPGTGVALRDGSSSDAPSVVGEASAADAGTGSDARATDAASAPFRILLFSRTAGFRHASIPTALAALMDLQASGGYVAEATEDPTAFTSTNLSRFQVVVFALTSGDALNDAQQIAFQGWVAAGGGYVGIHSASDTEYDWPYYGELVGAYFSVHPAVQTATVRVEAPTHPVMLGVPITWSRRDEWYDFNLNPRGRVTVLATLDESTYTGGTMGADHPIAWVHATAGGGRSFYTALGHTPESYAEAPFRRHLVNGIRWAAQR